ncbi:MAG: trans-sialidase, partial [Nitrosopumilus sp.]|nr:trans-sialidase [Nitrosopumilus sp.]
KPAETKPAEPKKDTLPKGTAKPAETKPAEPKKDTLPKGTAKPAEVPKPAETKKQLPATFNEALENAYYTAPMTDFHKYRTSVTGYSPAPNRYFVRHTAPVGKVPTTNWNDQKASVTGYTQPSNQYFATRQRLAYHPADKTFGSFSGVKMTVDGVTIQEKKQEPPKEAPKPKGTLPKGTAQTQSPPQSTTNTQSKSRTQQLEDYENDYLKRLEQDRIDQQKAYEEAVKKEAAEAAARAQSSGGSARGTLPKGFEAKPAPETPKSSKGTLPKGF